VRKSAPWVAGLSLEIVSGMKAQTPAVQTKSFPRLSGIVSNVKGRVLPPLLLYMFGVPGGLCLLLWVFFFRGK
jgi:hypothetical protein